MSSDVSPPTAAQWPDLSSWPDEDAPPLEWARFYRDHCGWIVVPCAGPMDVLSYARSLAVEATAAHVVDHGGEPDEEASEAIWDAAREEADSLLGRPVGYIYKAWMGKVAVASDVTDAMLTEAWEPLEGSRGPRAEADRRGVAVLPNRSARGLPVCLVDVDPRSGGEVDGPWGTALEGPKASTPGGGVHTLMLATGKEVAGCDLGPGVDVVAAGGTAIPLPSGSATPGRRWLRRDPPVVAPDALRKRGRKRAPPRPGAAAGAAEGGERSPGDDWGDDEGQGARIISQPTGDGVRNRDAGVIVGVLARPRSCPADFVRACLEMLAEDLARRDCSSADAAAEIARWRSLLTRGPRDADFACEVMETWLQVRGDGRRMRTTPAKFCASIWRVCDRREDGRAGEEDLGVGPMVGVLPGNPPRDEATDEPRQDGPGGPAPADPVPFPPPTPEAAQAAVEASRAEAPRWRGGIDPATYAFSLGAAYTREDLRRDLEREPIRIDFVHPAVDFNTGRHSTSPDLLTPPVRFGWGAPLHAAKRGLMAGEFLAVGASSAGAGKTTFLAWLTNGLALQTASRLLGVAGYEDRPLCFPVWVTEMPKKLELYGRLLSSYLGFHRACLDAGPRAAEDPGVLAMAARLCMTPQDVVARAREMEEIHGNDERFPLCVARHHVIRQVKPSKLPRSSRRAGVAVHHRSGPDLVDHVADAVERFREELAALAGVTADKVLPVVIFDPVQRFAGGGGESEKAAIDAILGAANDVLCEELECVVVTTNDTTKKAAGGVTLDHFLSAEAPGLMADVFAGSQGIVHHASDVIAVHPERQDPANPGQTRMWARLLRSRGGGESPLAFPFEWDKALGRLDPRDPEPLRPPPEREDHGKNERGQRRGGGAGHGALVAVPRLDPDAEYRLSKSGARMRDGSHVEDVGLVFTDLARSAVAEEGRADPHPGKRWWPDVVVSGRGAATILAILTCRHEKLR